jgi:hypothetical protein
VVTAGKDHYDRCDLRTTIAVKIPVGVDFLGRPCAVLTMLKIAAADDHPTEHNIQPRDLAR